MKQTLALAIVAVAALVLLAAQSQDPKPAPDAQSEALVKALDALVKAQDRQAAAWEKLAERGWPTPENVTMTGAVPSSLKVTLSGDVNVWGLGTWSVKNQ